MDNKHNKRTKQLGLGVTVFLVSIFDISNENNNNSIQKMPRIDQRRVWGLYYRFKVF